MSAFFCSATILLSESDVMEALGHPESSTFSTVAKIRVAELPESTLACPRDQKTLRVITYESVELDICPGCRGLWLGQGEFARIRALKQEHVTLDVDLSSAGDGIEFGDVFDFIGDAVGSLFDGISPF